MTVLASRLIDFNPYFGCCEFCMQGWEKNCLKMFSCQFSVVFLYFETRISLCSEPGCAPAGDVIGARKLTRARAKKISTTLTFDFNAQVSVLSHNLDD